MKTFSIIFVFILIIQRSEQIKSIDGTWIAEADHHSSITFDKNMVYEMSDTDTTYSGKYFRSFHSCDSSYLRDNNDKNFEFLSIDDGRCFEITGLTDSILAFRHTVSGRMHIFYKKLNL